jgi:hypothetical protein
MYTSRLVVQDVRPSHPHLGLRARANQAQIRETRPMLRLTSISAFTSRGGWDLIADLHRNTEVGSSLHDDPREVASEDCPRVSVTPGICDCEGQ